MTVDEFCAAPPGAVFLFHRPGRDKRSAHGHVSRLTSVMDRVEGRALIVDHYGGALRDIPIADLTLTHPRPRRCPECAGRQ